MKKSVFIYIFLLIFSSLLVVGCDEDESGEAPPPPPPPPTDPADYSEDNVCDAEFCMSDEALSQTCQNFLASCIAAVGEARTDECVAGGLVICQNPDADPADVCNYEACGQDSALQQECLDFMAVCVDESVNAEECVGAMLFKCGIEG